MAGAEHVHPPPAPHVCPISTAVYHVDQHHVLRGSHRHTRGPGGGGTDLSLHHHDWHTEQPPYVPRQPDHTADVPRGKAKAERVGSGEKNGQGKQVGAEVHTVYY